MYIYNEKIFGFILPSELNISKEKIIDALKQSKIWIYTKIIDAKSYSDVIYLKRLTKPVSCGIKFKFNYNYKANFPVNNSDIEKPIITFIELKELKQIKQSLGIVEDVQLEWSDFRREE